MTTNYLVKLTPAQRACVVEYLRCEAELARMAADHVAAAKVVQRIREVEAGGEIALSQPEFESLGLQVAA
jgi:hypothetical protein